MRNTWNVSTYFLKSALKDAEETAKKLGWKNWSIQIQDLGINGLRFVGVDGESDSFKYLDTV